MMTQERLEEIKKERTEKPIRWGSLELMCDELIAFAEHALPLVTPKNVFPDLTQGIPQCGSVPEIAGTGWPQREWYPNVPSRAEIAMRVLSGMATLDIGHDKAALLAVTAADALLKELEKK